MRFKEAFEQENGGGILRAGHDAKYRKKTDRRRKFILVARRNSCEAVDVNVIGVRAH